MLGTYAVISNSAVCCVAHGWCAYCGNVHPAGAVLEFVTETRCCSSPSLPAVLRCAQTLIPDCVGRYITSEKTGSVQLASLINGRTYAKCWQALAYWIVSQYDQGNSTNVSPIGVILRSKAERDGYTKLNDGRFASFRFFHSFLDGNNLAIKEGSNEAVQADEVSTIRLNTATLAKLAGIETQTFTVAMSHLFRRLGEVLTGKEPVMIDFSVGSLFGDKGVVEFRFHDAIDEKAVSAEFLLCPPSPRTHARCARAVVALQDAPAPDPRLLKKGAKAQIDASAQVASRSLRQKYQLVRPAALAVLHATRALTCLNRS